jgi:hypothetical protein
VSPHEDASRNGPVLDRAARGHQARARKRRLRPPAAPAWLLAAGRVLSRVAEDEVKAGRMTVDEAKYPAAETTELPDLAHHHGRPLTQAYRTADLGAGPHEGWPRCVTAGALPSGSRKVSYLRLRMPVGLWVVRLGGCDLGRGAAAGVARLA